QSASGSGRQWQQVSAGRNFACGLLASGAAYCWGDNSYGQLGNGSAQRFTATLAPYQPVSQGPFKSIAAGGDHACAIQNAATVVCWGRRVSSAGTEVRPVPFAITNAVGV